jgi:hypothetical protein
LVFSCFLLIKKSHQKSHFYLKITSKHHFPIKNTPKITRFLSKHPHFTNKPSFLYQKHPFSYQKHPFSYQKHPFSNQKHPFSNQNHPKNTIFHPQNPNFPIKTPKNPLINSGVAVDARDLQRGRAGSALERPS